MNAGMQDAMRAAQLQVASEPNSGKVEKASTIVSGETKVAQRNESAATSSSNSGRWWKPVVTTAAVGGVAYGAYQLYNALPSVPQIPSYTLNTGSAFRDAAFVPNAQQSDVENAQRQVYSEMYPGKVNIAANPQVQGVQWGASFQGFDSQYRSSAFSAPPTPFVPQPSARPLSPPPPLM